MDLVYDLDGNYLYSSLAMPSHDLPITILAVVNQSYPGYVIHETVQQLDLGEVYQYEIILGGQSHMEIIVAEDGTVLCECDL